MSDLPCLRAVSLTAQGPLPRPLIPLLGMDDLEIGNCYARFLRNSDPLYDPKVPWFDSLTPSSLPSPPDPSLRTVKIEASHSPPRLFREAATYDDPKDKKLEPLKGSSSSVLLTFEPELHWSQPIYFPICGNPPDYGIDNYMTDINFDDPTKPYPVVHELSAKMLSKHRSIQRLAVSNPSTVHQKVQEADLFTQSERLLDELGRTTGLDLEHRESFDEIKKCLHSSSRELSVGQRRRMAEILAELAHLEWAVKKDFGHELDGSLEHDERFMLDMWQSTRLSRAAMADEEDGREERDESLFGPLKPLFGMDTEDEVEPSTELMEPVFGFDIEDQELEPFTDPLCFEFCESLDMEDVVF